MVSCACLSSWKLFSANILNVVLQRFYCLLLQGRLVEKILPKIVLHAQKDASSRYVNVKNKALQFWIYIWVVKLRSTRPREYTAQEEATIASFSEITLLWYWVKTSILGCNLLISISNWMPFVFKPSRLAVGPLSEAKCLRRSFENTLFVYHHVCPPPPSLNLTISCIRVGLSFIVDKQLLKNYDNHFKYMPMSNLKINVDFKLFTASWHTSGDGGYRTAKAQPAAWSWRVARAATPPRIWEFQEASEPARRFNRTRA